MTDYSDHYKPLPKEVTISSSKIHGLGLFSTEEILMHTFLGISHHKNIGSKDNYIRTPLGGFINHSDDPNCTLYKVGSEYLYLKTIKRIQKGTELTVKYSLHQ